MASQSSVGLTALETSPDALNLAFSADRHDYVIRCTDHQAVTLAGTIAPGHQVRAIPLGPGAAAPSTLAGTFRYTLTPPAGISVHLDLTTTSDPTTTLARYDVRCLPSTFPAITQSVTGTPQAEFYLVTRSGYSVVLNAEGTPVWWLRETPGNSIDAKIIDGLFVSGRAGGDYRFREWDGTIVRSVSDLDHHDLQMMPNGDLVGFQYYDSDRGLEEEARFVAIDASGNVLWEWLTEDHIAPEEMVPAPYKSNNFAHVNSVEPDGDHRVLMSARSLDAIYDIDMVTGAIEWKLGGTTTPESLTVSDDQGMLDESEVLTLFAGQHDARFLPDGTVSVMDNGSSSLDRRPRIVRFRLDLDAGHATIIETVSDTRAAYSGGTGSGRLLAGGNWVASWGFANANNYITELSPAGEPVLTVTGLGSYRAVPVEPGELDPEELRDGMDAMTGTPSGLTGGLADAETGEPIPWAGVALLRATDLSLATATVADGSGNYSTAVPAGSYFVYALDATGDHQSGFLAAPSAVTVGDGPRPDLMATLTPTRGAISGTITDEGTGAPVPGAWAVSLDDITGAPGIAVQADGTGRYTIPRLRAGRYRIVAFDPAGAHSTRFFPDSRDAIGATPLTVVAGGSTPADVVVPSHSPTPGAATLQGMLTESGSGHALGGVLVIAVRAADFTLAGATRSGTGGTYAMSVPAGAYKLAFLDPTGRHALEWHDGQPFHGLEGAASVDAPASTTTELDVTTGTVRGVVTAAPTGVPLPGAWVVAIGATGPAGGAIAAGDGGYTIAGLPPGPYRLAFVDPSGAHRTEYWDGSVDYPGASLFTLTAGQTRTFDAALDGP